MVTLIILLSNVLISSYYHYQAIWAHLKIINKLELKLKNDYFGNFVHIRWNLDLSESKNIQEVWNSLVWYIDY